MNFIIKILLLLFTSSQLFAQGKTNLEMINQLVDSSTTKISNEIINRSVGYNLQLNSVIDYSRLDERILSSFSSRGIKLIIDSTKANKLNYSITQTGVEYSDLFRDGLFGNYLLERKFVLSGNFSVQNSSTILSANTFYYTVTDTVPYDRFIFIENNSLPFTKGKVPEPPFVPSLLEPIVAITAVVVTVILFFSVRSK